jgi:hypothetical protein
VCARCPRAPDLLKGGTTKKKTEIIMSRLSEINETEKERFRRHAKKAQSSSLPYIQYKEGVFRMGKEGTDMNNTDWIAAPDLCCVVWNLYLNGSVQETRRTFMRNDDDPPRPDTHRDTSQWSEDPKDAKKLSDPWGRQIELPLIDTDDGTVAVFKATTVLGRAAVGRLLEDFAETARRPFVTLVVEPNPKNIHQMIPEFRITDYSDNDVDLPGFGDDTSSPQTPQTSVKAAAATNGTTPPRSNDMDDDIPF